MDATRFHQTFDLFDHPVLLKTSGEWLTNPAAQSLCLSQTDLEQLEQWGDGTSLWLSRQFYRVTAGGAEDGVLYMLQPDVFLSSAGENVSSQLRDRLNSLFGFAAALSQNRALRADPQAQDQLSAINRELYRVFRMVTQLERCSTSHPFTGRMELVDVAQWAQHLANEVSELFQDTGVAFSSDIDIQAVSMTANARQLTYMVLTLISNSLKNVPEVGGKVSLCVKRQQDQVVITVADNAKGFSPELMVRPLWNEPRRALPNRGLGLGLPLAQRVAAEHGGTLVAFPSPQGTRMVASLPIQEDPELLAQPGLPIIEDAPGFSLAKILLSDSLPRFRYYPNPDGDEE